VAVSDDTLTLVRIAEALERIANVLEGVTDREDLTAIEVRGWSWLTQPHPSAENDAPRCDHARIESWQKFGGTRLWRCLDCGADSRDDLSVIPPGVVPGDINSPPSREGLSEDQVWMFDTDAQVWRVMVLAPDVEGNVGGSPSPGEEEIP
jgi:hypothetical protein